MAEAGATVYINGRDKKMLDTRCKILIDLGYNAKSSFFDAKDVEAVEKFLGSTKIPIDTLVNNAAIRLRKPLNKISPASFSEILEANLSSIYVISRSFAIRLKGKYINGSLRNITSIAGPRARPGDVAYTATKGGLEAFDKIISC